MEMTKKTGIVLAYGGVLAGLMALFGLWAGNMPWNLAAINLVKFSQTFGGSPGLNAMVKVALIEMLSYARLAAFGLFAVGWAGILFGRKT